MKKGTCFFVAFLCLFLVPCVSAGLLLSDPCAIPAWTGTSSYDSGGELIVDVDYAVFAPGDYGGVDPSGGTEYVYAYQVFNNSPEVYVSMFSVGLIDDSGATGNTIDPAYGGDVAPTITYIDYGDNSFKIALFTPSLPAGQSAEVGLFTSPNPPVMVVSSVINGGRSAQGTAPTPVPEPATISLLSLAGLALVRKRRA